MKFVYRKKGLPKRLPRIPGGIPGLKCAYNIQLRGTQKTDPRIKVAVFRNKKSMRDFYHKILPNYFYTHGDKLETRCAGLVCKLAEEVYSGKDLDMMTPLKAIVDKNYFCLVLLVEGLLTSEILCHEAVHVGFAWDYRTLGKGPFPSSDNPEENVCYPAGMFYDAMVKIILDEKLIEN